MEIVLRQKNYKKDITAIPNWVDFKEIEVRDKNDSGIDKTDLIGRMILSFNFLEILDVPRD